MIFQRKVDRAMRYQKERNEQADIKKPTEEDKDKLSKKDLLAMIDEPALSLQRPRGLFSRGRRGLF